MTGTSGRLGAMFEEDNMACFQNKLGDMYNETFPLTEEKKEANGQGVAMDR
jgi:hypothetical protein